MALKFNPFSGTFDYVQDFTAPTFVAPVTITEVVGSSALTITGATQTASFPALSITQTWNNAGVTFTGIKANFTNTASAAASNVLDLQVGGSTVMKVGRSGSINVPLATNSSSIAIIGGNNPASALYDYFGLLIGTKYWATGTSGFRAASDMSIGWDSATAVTNNSPDLYLYRDAAGVLAQRNSTNAQAFRLYNTYTDASNYERLTFDFSSGTARIYHEKAGTGSVRSVTFLNGSGSTALGIPGAVTGLITMAQGTVTSAVAGRVYIGENVTATSGNHYTLNVGETANPSSTSTMAYVSARIAPTINYSNATPGAGSYEALKIAVTETALPTGTNYLIRASAGAAGTTDKFTVTNGGKVQIAAGPTLENGGSSTLLIRPASGSFSFNSNTLTFGLTGNSVAGQGSIIFQNANSTTDAAIVKDAANTLALQNSTNAQTFNIYNTYTDASNYERYSLGWVSNAFRVEMQKAGTGSARSLVFAMASGRTVTLDDNCNLIFSNSGSGVITLGTLTAQLFVSYATGAGFGLGDNNHYVTFGGTSAKAGPVLTIYGRDHTNRGAWTLAGFTHTSDLSAVVLACAISGVTAYASAATNILGGNVTLAGGAGASGSAGVASGGSIYLDGGRGYGTGVHGNVYVGNTRGNLQFGEGANAVLGTTTGTKFGTATTQKLGFWNATPIVQPDTAVAAATFTANAGTAVNDASTFDGYTLNQIVKALRNTGLLA